MAFWDSVRDTVGSIAPTIGMALGGPLGGLAGQALASVLGVDPADENALKKAVGGMTADQALALKQAELQFKQHMANLEVDLERINASDRDSARQREASVKDWMPSLLSGLITAGFFGVLFYMLTEGLPDKGGDALLVMLGSLGTAWMACVSYYFGSSSGSAEKTRIMAAGK